MDCYDPLNKAPFERNPKALLCAPHLLVILSFVLFELLALTVEDMK